MAKSHELKTWTEYYDAIVEPDILKRKTIEIRIDDRNYEVGDLLILKDYNTDYTGRECWRLVTHCLRDTVFIREGYVAMSICEINPKTMFGI